MKRGAKANEKGTEKKFQKDLFGRPVNSASMPGEWDSRDNGAMLIFTAKDCEGRSKIASYDMDGTLITTKSGRVFPKDEHDWMLLDKRVSEKIQRLHGDGYKIVIFTNQKGLLTGKVKPNEMKRKIAAVISKLGVPAQAFVAGGDGFERKPCPGMWDQLKEKNDGVDIDMEESFYCGDAAGRHKTKIREKRDHSFADRLFAENVGVRFMTPEECFFEKPDKEPWGPLPFIPKHHLDNDLPQLEPEDSQLPHSQKEVIVMVGFPGSGKSTFAKKLHKEHGYEVVNRDSLGTWQKCLAAMKTHLKEGKSVVIDNTNPDKESRNRYVMACKELNVPVRCFVMACNEAQARHNVKHRTLTCPRSVEVSGMVLRMFNNKYQEPTLSEGFDEVVKVNFKPNFENDEHRRLYALHLVEHSH